MRRPARLFAALIFGLAAACAAPGLQPTGYKARNAIVLVLDGPRQSEMWAQPGRPLIPRMDGELRPQGVLLTGFRNNGPTYTNAGHAALCTGVYEELENTQGSQLPSRPGIFQRFLQASGLPASQAWVIASKDKLGILGDSADAAFQGRWRPTLWVGRQGRGLGSGYGDDADTRAAALRILAEQRPRLVLINLKQPDAAGHKGDWDAYQQGIRDGDAFAAELWARLQADPHYQGRTALFVTHDHGRHLDGHKDGFVSHGDACEGCRRIALLALGPDFKRGVTFDGPAEQVDLPVTLARLLGFPLPQAEGRFLQELFAERP